MRDVARARDRHDAFGEDPGQAYLCRRDVEPFSDVLDDAAAARAITARTGNRYGPGWLQRKLAIARKAATIDALRGYLAMFTSSAVTGDTQRLTAPLHIVNGAQDIPFYRGEASHNAFEGAYKHATFETIDDAGHYAMLETPVRVASIIEKQVAVAG